MPSLLLKQEEASKIIVEESLLKAGKKYDPDARGDTTHEHFVEDMKLHNLNTNHKTYHHFTGDGLSDSSIDVLLESSSSQTEAVLKILCLKAESNIDPHHDIIVSKLAIPRSDEAIPQKPTEAPRVENNRVKVIWSESGITQYCELLSPALTSLRDYWSDSSSPSEVAVLIKSTNEILSSAAQHTNKTINLSKSFSPKSHEVPSEVKVSAKRQQSMHKQWLDTSENPDSSYDDKLSAKERFKEARKEHRRVKRKQIVLTDGSQPFSFFR